MGIYNLVRLKNDAKMILEDNYESLDYCHIMQRQLDSFNIDRPDALRNFDDALQKQENNITEPGEYDATAELRSDFDKLKKVILDYRLSGICISNCILSLMQI